MAAQHSSQARLYHTNNICVQCMRVKPLRVIGKTQTGVKTGLLEYLKYAGSILCQAQNTDLVYPDGDTLTLIALLKRSNAVSNRETWVH